jgi:hypothetical protein
LARKVLGGTALIVVGLLSTPARAASTVVLPGDTLDMTGDIYLDGADTFTAGGDGPRCKINGNGFSILTEGMNETTGSVIIRNCDIVGMGTADLEAFILRMAGNGKFIVEGSTLSTSGRIDLRVRENVDVILRGNTITEDSVNPAVTLLLDSPPAVWVTGETAGMKLIQGNLIEKGRLKFTSTSGWIVGGSMPGDGNVMIGVRVGFELENASAMEIRGNYSHTLVAGDRWNQVKNLSINGGGENIIEHNILWGRNWLAEMSSSGELRYNLLVDAAERGWVLTWADAEIKVHHNVLIATNASPDGPTGGIVLESARTMDKPLTNEVFNNTLDLGGKCNAGVEGAVVARDITYLKSLRSNVFAGVRVNSGMGMPAIVRSQDPSQPLDHLGYSDYNLFFTPDSPVKVPYSATVRDKTMGQPGFAMNDKDQTDPQFTGPVPRVFPFDEGMIKQRVPTICQMLAYYRSVYMPRAGSPVIDAGDPAEGAGNDIGAVGAGAANDADLFGLLCDPTGNDKATPTVPGDLQACPPVNIVPPDGPSAGTGSGGSGGIKRPEGITCVCKVGDGAGVPSPGPATLGLLAAVGLLASRRRNGRRGGR